MRLISSSGAAACPAPRLLARGRSLSGRSQIGVVAPRPRPVQPGFDLYNCDWPGTSTASQLWSRALHWRWFHLITDPAFRRHFCGLHGRPAPMLGFLCNELPASARAKTMPAPPASSASRPRARPSPVASSSNVPPPQLPRTQRSAPPSQTRSPPATAATLTCPPRRPRSWNVALLCEDHSDESFRVILVGTDADGTIACIHSSPEPAVWSEPAYAPQHLSGGGGDHVDAVGGTLLGNALYFICQRTRVLMYDLGTRTMSVVHLPPASHNQHIALTTHYVRKALQLTGIIFL
ncbi:uncharacterized protein C2845_PM13G08710 [Panicum miliaceum]|uniref:F-box protein n=1 Tax=Panicum miliaceum TaxID=4540 RepID=A0A3L6RGC7_PANMI|nr:uncharacterized protein C2845_PM13G08710 [Panicum miliaceum]